MKRAVLLLLLLVGLAAVVVVSLPTKEGPRNHADLLQLILNSRPEENDLFSQEPAEGEEGRVQEGGPGTNREEDGPQERGPEAGETEAQSGPEVEKADEPSPEPEAGEIEAQSGPEVEKADEPSPEPKAGEIEAQSGPEVEKADEPSPEPKAGEIEAQSEPEVEKADELNPEPEAGEIEAQLEPEVEMGDELNPETEHISPPDQQENMQPQAEVEQVPLGVDTMQVPAAMEAEEDQEYIGTDSSFAYEPQPVADSPEYSLREVMDFHKWFFGNLNHGESEDPQTRVSEELPSPGSYSVLDVMRNPDDVNSQEMPLTDDESEEESPPFIFADEGVNNPEFDNADTIPEDPVLVNGKDVVMLKKNTPLDEIDPILLATDFTHSTELEGPADDVSLVDFFIPSHESPMYEGTGDETPFVMDYGEDFFEDEAPEEVFFEYKDPEEVFFEGKAPEEFSQDKAPEEEFPHDEAPEEEIFHDIAPVEETFHDEAPEEEIFHDEAPVEEAFHEEAPVEEIFHDVAPVEETFHDETPVEEIFHDKVPVEEFFHDELSEEEFFHGETSEHEFLHEEYPEGIFYDISRVESLDEAPGEESYYEEAPWEKFYYEEAPWEEFYYDEAPGEEFYHDESTEEYFHDIIVPQMDEEEISSELGSSISAEAIVFPEEVSEEVYIPEDVVPQTNLPVSDEDSMDETNIAIIVPEPDYVVQDEGDPADEVVLNDFVPDSAPIIGEEQPLHSPLEPSLPKFPVEEYSEFRDTMFPLSILEDGPNPVPDMGEPFIMIAREETSRNSNSDTDTLIMDFPSRNSEDINIAMLPLAGEPVIINEQPVPIAEYLEQPIPIAEYPEEYYHEPITANQPYMIPDNNDDRIIFPDVDEPPRSLPILPHQWDEDLHFIASEEERTTDDVSLHLLPVTGETQTNEHPMSDDNMPPPFPVQPKIPQDIPDSAHSLFPQVPIGLVIPFLEPHHKRDDTASEVHIGSTMFRKPFQVPSSTQQNLNYYNTVRRQSSAFPHHIHMPINFPEHFHGPSSFPQHFHGPVGHPHPFSGPEVFSDYDGPLLTQNRDTEDFHPHPLTEPKPIMHLDPFYGPSGEPPMKESSLSSLFRTSSMPVSFERLNEHEPQLSVEIYPFNPRDDSFAVSSYSSSPNQYSAYNFPRRPYFNTRYSSSYGDPVYAGPPMYPNRGLYPPIPTHSRYASNADPSYPYPTPTW